MHVYIRNSRIPFLCSSGEGWTSAQVLQLSESDPVSMQLLLAQNLLLKGQTTQQVKVSYIAPIGWRCNTSKQSIDAIVQQAILKTLMNHLK